MTNFQTQIKHKKSIVECILATDMASHGAALEQLKRKKEAGFYDSFNRNVSNDVERPKISEEDVQFTKGLLVHAADLNNPCLSFKNYMNWAKLITQEFHEQTVAEKEHNIPVTGFLEYKGEMGFYNGQKFFASQLVLPLFELIHDCFKIAFDKQIKRNLEALDKEIKKLKEKEAVKEKVQQNGN